MGYETKIKGRNYWKNWSNIKDELLIIYKEIHEFPNFAVLKSKKKYGLLKAIYKYRGGLVKVRKIFEENNYYN